MVAATIRAIGFVERIAAIRSIGEAGKAVSGPLATFGSRLPYTFGIETGRHRSGRLARRAGGALMFRQGAADAQQLARQILPGAIVRGPAAVGAAKRRIRDYGVERIRKYWPVRSGAGRASVSELNRPGIV